jgi:iron-sulfur cluster repair protein YtfE (RIC family)
MTHSSAREIRHDAETSPPLTEWTIRELVERYPETMTVLGPLGIDLCCGGAHPLGEALDLHGLERATVLSRITAVVAASGGEGR